MQNKRGGGCKQNGGGTAGAARPELCQNVRNSEGNRRKKPRQNEGEKEREGERASVRGVESGTA